MHGYILFSPTLCEQMSQVKWPGSAPHALSHVTDLHTVADIGHLSTVAKSPCQVWHMTSSRVFL